MSKGYNNGYSIFGLTLRSINHSSNLFCVKFSLVTHRYHVFVLIQSGDNGNLAVLKFLFIKYRVVVECHEKENIK